MALATEFFSSNTALKILTQTWQYPVHASYHSALIPSCFYAFLIIL